MITNHPSVRWPAPAKVNRFLHIVGRREDGYHLLESVFQLIDWHDWLSFRVRPEPDIRLSCNLPALSHQDNLAYRAAALLKRETQCPLGVDIHLEKHIPMGAGLGGGSSDAATVLVALNHLWQLNLSSSQLADMALQLGADVPFFIHGHNAYVTGIGEHIEPIDIDLPTLLLVTPNVHVSTQSVFQHPDLTRESQIVGKNALPTPLGKFGRNDCEPLVRTLYPEIDAIFQTLEEFCHPRLTGTGATVYAMFDNPMKARKIAPRCSTTWKVRVVNTLPHSPLLEMLGNGH